MTFEQLRIFVAVAERQHMTAAAQALGLTQSAASAAIAALEQRYHTKLFHRIGRGIALTEEGARFLIEARAVLARVTAAEQIFDDMSDLRHGTLRVHASQTIGGYWLPRHLVDFRETYPGIALEFTIGNTEQVAAAIYSGDADLGFVEGEVANPVLQSTAVARDRLMLVVGPRHPWAGRRSVSPAELVNTTWVLRERGSGTRAIFESALKSLRVKAAALKVVMELPSNEAVRGAVMAGTAATVISASVVVGALEAGLLHALRFNLPERAFCALSHKDRGLSRSARALLDIIQRKKTASGTTGQ